MDQPPRPAHLALLCSFVAGLLSSGAGCSDRLRIEVAVQGVRSEVYGLAVQATFAGQPLPEHPVNDRLDGFVLTLPEASRGALALHVEGLDTRGCAIASGDASLTVAGTAAHATVTLTPLAAPSCLLAVRLGGTGAGTVSAAGVALACSDTCQAPLPPGQRVTLEARPAPGSFFAGWSGACTGTGPCTLTPIGRGGAKVEASFVPAEQCTSSGFCWENPLPSGDTLERVHGASRNDVWAVGDAGATLRWNGSYFVPQPRVVSTDLHGVWAVAPDDVWMVGDRATVLRFDGRSLTQLAGLGLTDEDLRDVWARGKDDVWLVGARGAVLRWDGRTFLRLASDPGVDWYTVRGGAAGEVLLAGRGGALARFDGGALTLQPSLGAFDLVSLSSSAGEVVAVGGRIGGVGDQSALGVIRASSGAGFAPPIPDLREFLRGAFHAPGGDLWVVGDHGTLLHRRQAGWALEDASLADAFRGVWGVADDDLWLVGEGGLLRHWNGTLFTSLSSKSGSGEDLLGVWGSGPRDVWAVGRNSPILHYDGAAWRPIDDRRRSLRQIWGGKAGDAWAVGEGGAIMHLVGQRWEDPIIIDGGVIFYAVWGSGPDDVWIGGSRGALVHISTSGGVAPPVLPAAETIRALWGSAADDIWAVGEAGLIRHFDGQSWSKVDSGTSRSLLAVWGSGPRDVWAAGEKGALLRNRGQGFQVVADGPAQLDPGLVTLSGLCGSGPDDVWAVGQGANTVYHFDGSRWEPRGHIGLALVSLACPGSQVWAVGASGAIVHRR